VHLALVFLVPTTLLPMVTGRAPKDHDDLPEHQGAPI